MSSHNMLADVPSELQRGQRPQMLCVLSSFNKSGVLWQIYASCLCAYAHVLVFLLCGGARQDNIQVDIVHFETTACGYLLVWQVCSNLGNCSCFKPLV